MDTREKIIHATAGGILALPRRGRKLKAIVTHFDPVYAPHIRRLRELADGSCLVIVLTSPPAPILSPRARAELAAGLAMVDYVIMPDGVEIPDILHQLAPDSIVSEESADRARSAELMAHVHARQRSGPSGK